MAVGLSTIVHGIGSRKDIDRNLQIVEDGIHAAVSIIGINMPVRLIALAEGALTGFTDEIFDVPHVTAARDLFVDIPGPETGRLAALARQYGTYIVAQCKARWPEVIDDRFFNTLFVISPQGEIVHKAAKNHLWCRERSCVPHDVYDRWVELFGAGIDAFYPVLRTNDIGNIGTICCSDGEYPEAVRALAFNGAEVVYRPSEAVPMTQTGMEPGGTWLLQNRAMRISTTSTWSARTSARSTCTPRWSTRTTSAAATPISSITRAACSGTPRPALTRSSPGSSTSRPCASSAR
jgi:beta-ureidopropionase